MELVSIVVPVYNIENYIGNCVESLINQTYGQLEIILVDDGGTDQGGKICDDYAKRDSRIHVLHKENGGLSDARNKGAEYAHGKYLFFVDGDDTVSSNIVEKTVQYAETYDAEMVLFDYESIEEETGRRDLYHFGLPENRVFSVEDCPEVLIKSPSAWSRMYCKEFWDRMNIRYPIGIHYEDLATTPRFLLNAKRICYLGEEPFYYYMLRQGSIMRSYNFERSFQDRTYVLDFLMEYWKEQKAEEIFRIELEALVFEHGYFVPSKEIVLVDAKSPWLSKFREYALSRYPEMLKNPYIGSLSKKDKILLFLMNRKFYGVMNLLSGMRKMKDSRKKDNGK